MIPRPYQLEMARDALEIIREHSVVYLAAEERTGKSLAAVLVAEMSKAVRVLILTKKKPLGDWLSLLDSFQHFKDYTVTNYHNAHKLKGPYDLVILDEAHNYLSAFPKIGLSAAEKKQYRKEGKVNTNIYDNVKRLCKRAAILYVSATPHAQGPQMLYHQFALSSWSPWRRFDNFYRWFDKYGIKETIELHGIETTQYTKCKTEEVMKDISHLFVKKTRAECGFEHEPEDKIHWIELSENTKDVYNVLLTDRILETPNGLLVCDTKSKLRYALHMLEGGSYKIGDDYFVSPHITEKVDYILKTFGDSKDLVIMYNYKGELLKLQEIFKNAALLQGTSYAEGVDLYQYKHLVIYSQDFSTARHTQRRARQCNKQRDEPITVHHLLVKGGSSHDVFKCVSVNKVNYVDSLFKGKKL